MNERREFARLTAEILAEVRSEDYLGQNRSTTRKIDRALRMARELVEEEPGYRPALDALRRMKRKRA